MTLFDIGIRFNLKRDTSFRSILGTQQTLDSETKPKRVLIHGFYFEAKLIALTLLDVDQRTMETHYHEHVATAATRLKDYAVVIGMNPRKLMGELGIKDLLPWRLIDLAGHPRSKLLNQRGRKLAITTELLITSSTGISKPLGDPVKMRGYWRDAK